MKIVKEKKNDITFLIIEGNLNTMNSNAAQERIRDIIDREGPNIVINLSKLRYISKAGLRTILISAKDVKSKNGKLVLCSMPDSIKKDFDITGFSSRFDIQDTVEAAIKRF